MFRAVIFDFDGVIADSEMMHFAAFNKAMEPYNVQISKQQYFKDYLGLTDIDLIKTLTRQGTLNIKSDEINSLAQEKKQIFENLAGTDADIIDGVKEFLELLERNYITKAICSGALMAEIQLILDKANLASYFETIVSAEQVAKGKPAPDGFLLTLEKLNSLRQDTIEPCQCVVIEDSHWGIEAAAAAKMHTVAVTNSYDADELGLAEKIVDNLRDLSLDTLQNLCK